VDEVDGMRLTDGVDGSMWRLRKQEKMRLLRRIWRGKAIN